MSSGHAGRSGRGNRRARRGSQRPRGPEGQNGQGQGQGQSHSSSAMLILSSGKRQSPAHTPRDVAPDDEDAVLEEDEAPADGEMSVAGDKTVAPPFVVETKDGAAASTRDAETQPNARQERQETQETSTERHGPPFATAPGGGRGPHERGQPYAPGMRAQTQPPALRGPVLQRDGTIGRSGNGPKDAAPTEYETDTPAPWPERDNTRDTGDDTRDVPAVSSRPPRAEREDQYIQGEHAPLRPEVRGEVGPLIDALHGIFEQDRATASQGGTTRCGICYLHFALVDLEYREAEGYYVCRACARSLGNTRLPMVRRQQRT